MFLVEQLLGFKLSQVILRIHQSTNEDFSDEGLTFANFGTLATIANFPGLTQNELSEKTRKNKNVIVQFIDKFEKKNLVERRKHPTDRRSHALYLTEQGKDLVDRNWHNVVESQKKLEKEVSEEEWQIFIKVLDKLMYAKGDAE